MDKLHYEGTPLSILLQRAAKLKSSETSHLRSTYDSYPPFYQNSICPRKEVEVARNLSHFEERMAEASRMKEEGNEAFGKKRWEEALTKYEMASAVFRYLRNGNPEWRTQGIRDQDIRQILDRGQTPVQSRNVAAFLRICHTNMALALCQLGDYRQAIRACDCAIDLFSDGEEEEEDGRNGGGANDNHDVGNGSGIGSDGRSKAYLIRAEARLAPKSCGVAEEEMALSDLEMARSLNPRSKEIRNKLINLKKSIQSQKRKDKSTFRGLFDRGQVYSQDDHLDQRNSQQQQQQQQQHKQELSNNERDILMGKQLIQMYQERGMLEEKAQLEKSVQAAITYRNHATTKQTNKTSHGKFLDFRNPTEEMVESAKSMGVDLGDESVLEYLERLERERRGRDDCGGDVDVDGSCGDERKVGRDSLGADCDEGTGTSAWLSSKLLSKSTWKADIIGQVAHLPRKLLGLDGKDDATFGIGVCFSLGFVVLVLGTVRVIMLWAFGNRRVDDDDLDGMEYNSL